MATKLREFLIKQEGFISIERFQSLTEDAKVLSLSYWQNEVAIKKWRNLLEHRAAQERGNDSLFSAFRIRVAEVVRDYSESSRSEAPADSNILRK